VMSARVLNPSGLERKSSTEYQSDQAGFFPLYHTKPSTAFYRQGIEGEGCYKILYSRIAATTRDCSASLISL